ncbi:MAG: hypothetical protein QOC82_3004 [Frankiaceae bacterium]|nr:hypothetical protein [Frankiaceae bacterium]
MIVAALTAATTASRHQTVVFQLGVDKVALAIGALIALAALAIVVVRRERPPAAGPRTLDLPPQSPAVAALLVNTREVPGEAAAATLVDLASRGVLEIVEMGGGTPGVRLTRRELPDLTPYEKRVLDLVRAHADGDGIAPGGALALAGDKESTAWLEGLRAEVRAEAQRNGWVRSRYGREVLALGVVLAAAALVIGIWGYATATTYNSYLPHPVVPNERLRNLLALAAVVVGVLDFVIVTKLAGSHAQLLTRAGRPVAAAWLGVAAHLRDDEQLSDAPPGAVAVWHRLLAYATAFGVAHRVQEELPLGPESTTHAWSAESGRWRIVRIRYPKWWPPGWGKRPGEMLLQGAILGLQSGVPIAVIVVLGSKLADASILSHVNVPWYAYLIAAVVVGAFALSALRAVVSIVVGLATLAALAGAQREVTGRAVRVRPITGDGGKWVALDDGSRNEIPAYQVRIANDITQGDRVRLRVRPITGEVRSAEVVGDKPA